MPRKPYTELTQIGRYRRMRPIALKALFKYPINVRSIKALSNYTNMNFKVITNDDRKFVLRVCSPGWRTPENLYSEVEWLLGIHNETDIPAPIPLLTKSREPFVNIPLNSGLVIRCVLFSWLPGTLLAHRLSTENLFQMGQLFAKLHEYSLLFKPSPKFSQLTMNSVLARGEKNAIFSAAIQRELPRTWRNRLEDMRKCVVATYKSRYQNSDGLRVIHHDLHHENILIHHGTLQPFDFEDTTKGFPVQDIAMAMLDLLDDTGPERYRVLYDHFRAGYESICDWPETYPGEIQRFQQGRRLWVANWHAHREPSSLLKFITRPLFDSIPIVK